ncbi:MAG: S8 family serine peptidase [Neisseriaceae bacterium]|nr:S8 family serine peptidase [Neisseriaceae bacterium]
MVRIDYTFDTAQDYVNRYLIGRNINGLGPVIGGDYVYAPNDHFDYAFQGLGNDEQSLQYYLNSGVNRTALEVASMRDKVASRLGDTRVLIYDTGVDLTSNMIDASKVDATMYVSYDSKNDRVGSRPTGALDLNQEQAARYPDAKYHGTHVLSTVQMLSPNSRIGVYVVNGQGLEPQDAVYIDRHLHRNDNRPIILNASNGVEKRLSTYADQKDFYDRYYRTYGKGSIRAQAQYLKDNNGLLVISAGNEAESYGDDRFNVSYAMFAAREWPEEFKNHYIAVTGVNEDGTHMFDSCHYWSDFCVAAPSYIKIHGETLTGTSFAAPFVTGTLASIQNRYDWMTTKNLQEVLFTTATPQADTNTYGHGIVNYFKATQGYGRFDENTELNVNGTKARYYFDNNISGKGGLTKLGNKSLVLNGDNTYTGGTFVKEGELVLNGRNDSSISVNSKGTLTVGDRSGIRSRGITLRGKLNALTASDIYIAGNLRVSGTINKAIGSRIGVKNVATFLDGNKLNVQSVVSGYTTKDGERGTILSATGGIVGVPNIKFTLPDLISASSHVTDKAITVAVNRKSASVAASEAKQTQFEGLKQNAQSVERFLSDIDVEYLDGKDVKANSAAMSFVMSDNLDKTMFENGTMTAHHAVEEINLNKQAHDLDFVDNLKHGSNVWISGSTDRNKLKLTGLDGKSEDYSVSVGVAKKIGDGTIGGALNTPKYRWEENFEGASKTVKADGVGVNVGYAHEFDSYRAFATASYDKLDVDMGNSKNNDGYQYSVAVGAEKTFDLGKLDIAPSLALQYSKSKIDGIRINDNVRADDIESHNTSVVAGVSTDYALLDSLRLKGNVGVAQDLEQKTKHTAVYDNKSYVISEREAPKTRFNTSVGLGWNPTTNTEISANVGYTAGNHWHRTEANVGLRYKF